MQLIAARRQDLRAFEVPAVDDAQWRIEKQRLAAALRSPIVINIGIKMNPSDEYNISSRYRTIRKHLDSLGYRQTLSLDALPLVEKLLADLIQTTDSLKHFKTLAQDNVEACSELRLSVDPYKCDNARLVGECNRLHSDLAEAKAAHQRQAKELKKRIYDLESECNNLQLASSKNLKRIKELEAESARKSKRIQELLGKCCKPLISNAALASKKRPCYPLRRPTFESDPLPRVKGSLPSLSRVEPSIVDLLAMADRKINSLGHEVTTLKGELSAQADNAYTLKSQEKEIARLKKMLEGGRPASALSKDCSCRKSDHANERNGYEKAASVRTVCHRGSADDNEFKTLQQVKLDLEQQLREALDKQHDAMSQAMKLAERNEELEKELRDIDHIALAVEADCNTAVKENNKRVSHLQEKLESVLTQVHVLEGELMVERRSAQEMRADLEAGRLEIRNLQRKLESTLEEKKRMTDRINELTVIEKTLNDEIQRLSSENGDLRLEVTRLDRVNDLLKEHVQSDEKSRGVAGNVKGVKEKTEKNDKNRGGKAFTRKKVPASRGRGRSFSPPVQEKQPETRPGDSKENEAMMDSNLPAARNNCQRVVTEKDSEISRLQATIDQLQTDRDYYKNEYNRLREQCSKSKETDNAELWGQVCDLRRQLIEGEHTVSDLQREKKELCRDKFELELRLQSLRTDRRKAGDSCAQCRPIGNCSCAPNGDSKAMLERLERERDAARADVDRLVEERDALRERLKLAVEAHKFEQQRLRQNLSHAETRLSQLERERQDILIAQGTQRATISGFEDQIEDLREELRCTKQELTTQRTQYFQLRTLQDQADQALGDVQSQLGQTEAELYKAMDRNRLLEQQKLTLDNDVKGLKQEINTLRASVSRAEQEKDQITIQLTERSERIALLERELKLKEQEIASVEKQCQELQQKNQICLDQSAEQERRLRNMQMEMEMNHRQLAAASSDRDNAAQENRRLQDDLAAVTCEIRTLQRELEGSRAESFDLKRQLQTYVSEVRRAEDLINRKENERTEMLNHFRSLSLEATMLENNNHSLESEAAEARGALQSARDRALDLERQLTDRDCMIRGYEAQITELTQTVASLETQIRQQIEQRQRAEADLNAVRDLCVKLDQQKESLVKELGDKDAMKAQYEAQLARLKAEQNMVQDQISRDHVTVERLENLLDQARQESMDGQANNQELQCEMSRLKQKMCELQTKLSSESAELRRYQNQAAEYSKQISELRRQVTNERFDRARKDEEHRRYSQIGNTEEYRSRLDLRLEARRTNRFDTSNPPNAPPIRVCKCTGSNGKMYNGTKPRQSGCARSGALRIHSTLNADETTTTRCQGDRDAGGHAGTDEASGEEEHHAAAGPVDASDHSGGLWIRARLEEDTVHRDIRVRISDSSGRTSFQVDGDKRTVLRFCTPLVSSEPTRGDSTTDDPALTEVVTDQPEVASTRENEAAPRGSSEISEVSRNINGTLRVTRDDATNREVQTSATKKRAIGFLDDNTSGYGTSEPAECLCDNLARSGNGEIVITNDTLGTLHRLLADADDSDNPTRERSRSVPRSHREGPLDRARSSLSFPVRVDYSEAAITVADLTRPEFVRMLTELKEQTRYVEKELSRMNNAMRNSPELARLGGEKNKVRVCYEAIDELPGPSDTRVETETSKDVSLTNSSSAIHEKASKRRRNNNVAKQIDSSIPDAKGSRKSARDVAGKNEEIPEEQINARSMERSCDCEEPTDSQLRTTQNRIFPVERKDSSSVGTQASADRNPAAPDPVSTVNESVLFKPSRIHKLKRAPGARDRTPVPEARPRIDEPENSGRAKSLAKLMCSSRPRVPADSPIRNPERARSFSTQSIDNRVPISTSTNDFQPTAPPTTPVKDDDHETQRQASRFNGTTSSALRSRSPAKNGKTKTPEATRLQDRSGETSRSRKLKDSTNGLLKRRTPAMEYSKDDREKSVGSSSGAAKIPATRKLSKDELSLTNYSSTDSKLEHVGTVKIHATKKSGDLLAKDNAKRSKLQQRSRSDPRESRNHAQNYFR